MSKQYGGEMSPCIRKKEVITRLSVGGPGSRDKEEEKLVGDNIIGEKYKVILRISSLQISLGSALIASCSSEPL